MSQELVYTSAPTGLKPGSKGFCTVAITAGLTTAWIDRLEPLSAYRPIYPLGDAKSESNPVNYSHWRISVGGKTKSVLSRVAFAGADYSGRSNKLAHHIVLESAEQAAGGPAWMQSKPGLMRTSWTGAPTQLTAGPKLPAGDRSPAIAETWAQVRGDAGWAGVLAESFLTDPAKPVYIVHSPGTDVLRLFEESIGLLSPSKRWEITYSTFFTELPLNLSCVWRGVIAGTPAAADALRMGARVLLFDLTKTASQPPLSDFATAAREGRIPMRNVESLTRIESIPTPHSTQTTSVLADEDTPGLSIEKQPLLGQQVRSGSRKRLVPAENLYALEEELPADPVRSDPLLFPTQTVVHRGVPIWLTVIVASICLAAGVFIGMKLPRSSPQISQSAPNQTLPIPAPPAEGAITSRSPPATVPTVVVPPAPETPVKAEAKVTPPAAEIIKLQSPPLAKLPQGVPEPAQVKIIPPEEDDRTSVQMQEVVQLATGKTEIIFSNKPKDLDANFDPHFILPLPKECSNHTLSLSVVWPNGKNQILAAYEGKNYILTEKRCTNPLKVSISTQLNHDNDLRDVELVSVSLIGNTIDIAQIAAADQQAVVPAKTLLNDAVYILRTREGDRDKLWRFSLNRLRPTPIIDKSKNAFDPPSIPSGIALTDIIVDGGEQGWALSRDGTAGLFACDTSENQRALFKTKVDLASDSQWRIGVQLDAFKALTDEQSTAATYKTNEQKKAKDAKEALKRKKDNHISENLSEAQRKSDEAEANSQLAAQAADKLDHRVDEWRSKYQQVASQFPISLRLPNGVEILQIQIVLPPLPK